LAVLAALSFAAQSASAVVSPPARDGKSIDVPLSWYDKGAYRLYISTPRLSLLITFEAGVSCAK
jgi:hypothetical protein